MTEHDWLDISVPVHPDRIPAWPSGPPISLERCQDIARGDEYTETTLSFSAHTGTHIDAPAHFLGDGRTVDEVGLSAFIGPCRVVELTGRGRITASDLERAEVPGDTRRLLLRTDNSDLWSASFEPGFVGLTPDAARWIADRGMLLVGIDYLSVEPWETGNEVHLALLGGDVAILEGLDLSGVAAGRYELMCLPLKLIGCEGAPARALIRPLEASSHRAPDPG